MEVTSRLNGINLRNHRSFVQFDISAIPAGKTIFSASLDLYMETAPTASRNDDAHRISSGWAEGTITWNNQPPVAGSPTSSIATGTTSLVWKSWDVKSDVAAFMAGTYSNYGWRIRDQVEDTAGVGYTAVFRTSEYADPTYYPQLVVSYIP
jgi:hypothetical protein